MFILNLDYNLTFSAMLSYGFNLPILVDLKRFTVLCHIAHEPKSSFINRTALCPPCLHPFSEIWTIHRNFPVSTNPLLYFEVPIHLQGYVPACQVGHLSLHSDLFIYTSDSAQFGFHSVRWLANCISLAA